MKAFLILEDGTVFEGTHIGASKEIISEIVFNTSMAGYLEILTDPSYAGQAVCMTYPLIGNYGICRDDMESFKSWPDGFIVRELSRVPSNYRHKGSHPNSAGKGHHERNDHYERRLLPRRYPSQINEIHHGQGGGEGNLSHKIYHSADHRLGTEWSPLRRSQI